MHEWMVVLAAGVVAGWYLHKLWVYLNRGWEKVPTDIGDK